MVMHCFGDADSQLGISDALAIFRSLPSRFEAIESQAQLRTRSRTSSRMTPLNIAEYQGICRKRMVSL